MAIAPPLGASVCSLISQLPTSLSLYQLFWRQDIDRSLSFSFCANAATPVKVTSEAINRVRPKNLYITSVSLQCLGLLMLSLIAALKPKHRSSRRCGSYLPLLQNHDARNALQVGPQFE